MIETPVHRLERKIYLADTDATGFVYYARYLEWMESGRMELLERTGTDLSALQSEGINAVVRNVTCSFQAPLRLGDVVEVTTFVSKLGKTNVEVSYRFVNRRGNAPAGHGAVSIVFIDATSNRPTRIPEAVKKGLANFLASEEEE